MSALDILKVAHWLQDRHSLFLSTVDHPGRPECGGSHRECDGQRGKHPRGKWPRLATLSHILIQAQLADGPWNLLVACKRSALLVVDEDRPGAYAAFAAAIGEAIESTFAVRTAKGTHFYYRQAEGAPLGNGRGRLKGHGIDIRGGGSGDGGYVVGPGSVHETGVIYTPVDSTLPILPVPAWLAEVLRPAPLPERAQGLRSPASTPRALRGLVRVVLEAVPGERNDALFWSTCRVREMVLAGKLDESAAAEVLLSAATRNGLPEAEARRTVASGLRADARPRAEVRHG